MFYISRDGSSEGPFDAAMIGKMLADGSLKSNDSLWKREWEDWRAVSSEFPFKSSERPSVIAPARSLEKNLDSAKIGPSPVMTMRGVTQLLEVFPDKIAITPKGAAGFLAKGLKGTKFLPFYSITAIQFRKAGPIFSGYLQFTIPGGKESRGGIFAAARDENTFMFGTVPNNEQAQKIKDFIDREIAKLRSAPMSQVQSTSLADELGKLAELKSKGILSDEEFTTAKAALLK